MKHIFTMKLAVITWLLLAAFTADYVHLLLQLKKFWLAILA